MFVCRVGGRFLPVPDRNQHRRATIRRSRSQSQVVVAHRWRSLRERDVRLPVRGLSQMVPTARSERPETDEKGDRSEPGSVGANKKDRRSDKQRLSRSRRGATVLHARRPPRDVRMSRVPSIPEAHINSSNAFVLEPYRKRLKRFAGCMSEFLHDPPAFVVSKREWHTYCYACRRCLSWCKMFYHYRTSCIIRRHPDFDIAKVVANLEQ